MTATIKSAQVCRGHPASCEFLFHFYVQLRVGISICNLGANLEHTEVNMISLMPEIVNSLVYELLMCFTNSTDGKSVIFTHL